MKFIFLKSGDSLELNVSRAPIIESWFEYLFANNLNLAYSSNYDYSADIEEHLASLPAIIDDANKFILGCAPENTLLFEPCDELNQTWLNETHKLWAMLTDKYKNNIFPAPPEWHKVNSIIHRIEGYYCANFKNIQDSLLPEKFHKKIRPEDCEYTQMDLMLSFKNLGRHQQNQWLSGSDIDEETNNYKAISLDFEYRYFLETGPITQPAPPPIEYQQWCNKRNIPVLAPWIPIGKFSKYDRNEIKKIFHKNLKDSKDIGFEL